CQLQPPVKWARAARLCQQAGADLLQPPGTRAWRRCKNQARPLHEVRLPGSSPAATRPSMTPNLLVLGLVLSYPPGAYPKTCHYNSECPAPQSCIYGYCAACSQDKDCPHHTTCRASVCTNATGAAVAPLGAMTPLPPNSGTQCLRNSDCDGRL